MNYTLKPKIKNKALILTPDLNTPGGVSNYYNILAFDKDESISYLEISKSGPENLFSTIIRLFINYVKFAIKLINESIQIVVVNPSLDQGKSFHRDLVFILITRLLNKKIIVFFRGWYEPYEEKIKKSNFKSFLFNISYAKATKYLVLGDIFRRKLISLGVPAETEFLIVSTVADTSFLSDFSIQNKYISYVDEVKFLFLGRVEKDKGVYIAIEAFREFESKFPQRKKTLLIAGDGPDLYKVRSLVKENNLTNIKVLGHVDNDKKKAVLLNSHILFLPSYTEGLPNSILEGMLYGMPVISRITGGIPDVIKQDENGFLTVSFEPGDFVDFLSGLAMNGKLYKHISHTNHNIAKHAFTPQIVRKQFLEYLWA